MTFMAPEGAKSSPFVLTRAAVTPSQIPSQNPARSEQTPAPAAGAPDKRAAAGKEQPVQSRDQIPPRLALQSQAAQADQCAAAGNHHQAREIYAGMLVQSEKMTSDDFLYPPTEAFGSLYALIDAGVRYFRGRICGIDLAKESQAQCHEAIGRCLEMEREFDRAEEHNSRALAGYTELFGENSNTVARFHADKAVLYRTLGLPEKAKEHEYEAVETARLAEQRAALSKAAGPGRVHTLFSLIPDGLGLSLTEQGLRLETESAAKVLHAVPGLRISRELTVALDQIKGAELDGNTFRVMGKSSIALRDRALPDGSRIEMNNLSFTVALDPNRSGTILLSDIEGLEIHAGAINAKVRCIALSSDGKKLKVAVKQLEDIARQKPAQTKKEPAAGAPKKRVLSALVGAMSSLDDLALAAHSVGAIGKNTAATMFMQHEFDLEHTANGALINEFYQQAVSGLRERTLGAELRRQIEQRGAVLPLEMPQVRSVRKEGERVCVKLSQDYKQELGGLTLTVPKDFTIDTVSRGNDGLSVSVRPGIGAEMPFIPADKLALLEKFLPEAAYAELRRNGVSDTLRCNINSLSVRPGAAPNQMAVNIGMHGPLRSVSVEVDRDFKPISDAHGIWSARCLIGNPAAGGEPFCVTLRFDAENNLAMSNIELAQIFADAVHQGIKTRVDHAVEGLKSKQIARRGSLRDRVAKLADDAVRGIVPFAEPRVSLPLPQLRMPRLFGPLM